MLARPTQTRHAGVQIRRAVFGGPYIDPIESLAHNEKFLKIRRATHVAKDESDQELVLRFFALRRRTQTKEGFRGEKKEKTKSTYPHPFDVPFGPISPRRFSCEIAANSLLPAAARPLQAPCMPASTTRKHVPEPRLRGGTGAGL